MSDVALPHSGGMKSWDKAKHGLLHFSVYFTTPCPSLCIVTELNYLQNAQFVCAIFFLSDAVRHRDYCHDTRKTYQKPKLKLEREK